VQTTRNGDRNRVCRPRPTTGAHDRPSDAALFATTLPQRRPVWLEPGAQPRPRRRLRMERPRL